MYKISLVLCLVLAVAQGKQLQKPPAYYSPLYHTDDYINQFRQYYAKALKDFDRDIDHFTQHYAGRAEGINLYTDLVTDLIDQTNQRLNPLEILSEYSKQCVNEYRYNIPEPVDIQNKIGRCFSDASNRVDDLCNAPTHTRNALQDHYVNHFEKEIESCGEKSNTTQSYFTCISGVIYNTNDYTALSQKDFKYQLEAAECAAKANIKKALDCSYNEQNRIITLLSEANTSIQNCLSRDDRCPPCQFTCNYSWQFVAADSARQNVHNPFYGSKDHPECLLVNRI